MASAGGWLGDSWRSRSGGAVDMHGDTAMQSLLKAALLLRAQACLRSIGAAICRCGQFEVSHSAARYTLMSDTGMSGHGVFKQMVLIVNGGGARGLLAPQGTHKGI